MDFLNALAQDLERFLSRENADGSRTERINDRLRLLYVKQENNTRVRRLTPQLAGGLESRRYAVF